MVPRKLQAHRVQETNFFFNAHAERVASHSGHIHPVCTVQVAAYFVSFFIGLTAVMCP